MQPCLESYTRTHFDRGCVVPTCAACATLCGASVSYVHTVYSVAHVYVYSRVAEQLFKVPVIQMKY